jgi:MYXO-CTERM domain-containing protein
MKTSRIVAGVVATLALFAGDYAHADPTAAAGDTVVLNTFQTTWLKGDLLGPLNNGAPKLGKNTGAGLMDPQFTFDATNPADVLLGTAFTRSQATQNQNANNPSWMQGGFALAHLTATGVVAGPQIDLPELEGERTWMRPQIAFTPTHTILIAASEDNGVNNNPQPVMFIADRAGVIQKIPNNTRGANNLLKPTNLIQTALKQGIQVNNPNNQRGPHSITQVGPNSFVVGMQYNNQAAEAFKVTVAADGTVTMDWLKRYSNNAQHCRPQVTVAPGATEGFVSEVEANNQPAEIGFRITKFTVATGAVVVSKIAVRSDPKNNKYVAEPSVGLIGDKLAIGYQMSASVNRRAGGNNANGHAGGSQVSLLNLFSTTDLTPLGDPMLNAAAYGRHSTMFATTYGPNAEPALAYIGGSSTGTKGAFEQLIPLKADGTLGLKDAAKLYAVSTYSDVANVQARGKRNPNDQARGFINGLGSVPNPGYTTDATKALTSFMPETKSFSFSTITGYTDAAGALIGKRNSIYLSLVPASWATGIQTTPGSPTSTPGTTNGQPSQTGPAPRTTAPSTDPSGDNVSTGAGDTNVLAGTDPTTPDGTDPGRAQLGGDTGGCSVSSTSSSTSGGAGFILLAVAGVIIALRRKQEEV